MQRLILTSSNGNDQIRIEVTHLRATAHPQHLFLQCVFSGQCYLRDSSLRGEIDGSLRPDYGVSLPQVISTLTNLSECFEAVSRWLSTQELFRTTLAELNEQRLEFALELPKDFICSRERPVARFAYCVHHVALDVRFVVDASCMHGFAENIKDAVRVLSNNYQL